MDGKVTQARSMGISLRTSGKITEKGRLPSVGVTTQLEKNQPEVTSSHLTTMGESSPKNKAKTEESRLMRWKGGKFLSGSPCLKPVLLLDFLVSWANKAPFSLTQSDLSFCHLQPKEFWFLRKGLLSLNEGIHLSNFIETECVQSCNLAIGIQRSWVIPTENWEHQLQIRFITD